MKILVPDLSPGNSYGIQVRTNDGEAVSEWSPKVVVNTVNDNTIPLAPSGITWEVSGTSFLATWLAVTLNTNGKPFKDFKYYEVEVSNGTDQVQYRTQMPRWDFPLELNKSAFGSPSANVDFRVRAVDQSGQPSDWSNLFGASNPPPANPSNLVGQGNMGSVVLTWTESPSDDKIGYNVYVSSAFEGFTNSTSYVHPTFDTLQRTYTVKTVDVFGSESSGVSVDVSGLSTAVIDNTVPNKPTNLSGTLTNIGDGQSSQANLSWTAPTTNTDGTALTDLAGYRVRYKESTASAWNVVTVGTDTTTLVIPGLKYATPYDFQIEAFDFSGNRSGYTTTYSPAPQANVAPSTPAPPGVASATRAIQVTITGTKNAGGLMEGDVISYEVYASPNTGFAPSAATMLGVVPVGPAMVAQFTVDAMGTGTTQNWYVRIIAIDRGGLKSAPSPETLAVPNLILTANIGDLTVTNAKIADLSVDKLTAGTGIVNDFTIKASLTLGESAGVPGVLKSWDYVSGTTGFSLDSNGIQINEGVIKGRAVEIQSGPNMMPFGYADFEGLPTYYSEMYITDATVATEDDDARFNTHSLHITFTPNLNGEVWFARTDEENNIPFESNAEYILSYYYKNLNLVSPTNPLFKVVFDDGLVATMTTAMAAGDGTWRRGYASFFTTATASSGTLIITNNTAVGEDADILLDGIQIEARTGALSTPSPWNKPGVTSIHGDFIQTGTIKSEHLVTNFLFSQEAYIGSLPGAGLPYIQLGGDGIRLIDFDGTPKVILPVDISDDNPAYFDGAITAQTIEVVGDSTFGTGLDSHMNFAPESQLVLNDRIGKPDTLANTRVFLDSVEVPTDPTGKGMCKGSGSTVFVLTSDELSNGFRHRIIELNPDTGARIALHDISGISTNHVLVGIAYKSGFFYVMSDIGRVWRVPETTFVPSSSKDWLGFNDNAGRPTIGNDYTGTGDFMAVRGTTSGTIIMEHLTWGTGTDITRTVIATSSTAGHLDNIGKTFRYVEAGTFDLGATKYIFHGGYNDRYRGFTRSGTTLTYDGTTNWYIPQGVGMTTGLGMCWTGTRFIQMSRPGGAEEGIATIFKFNTPASGQNSPEQTWWIRYTFADMTGAVVNHETSYSKPRQITMFKRFNLHLKGQTPPGTVVAAANTIRWYIHQGANDDTTGATYYLQPVVSPFAINLPNPVMTGGTAYSTITRTPFGQSTPAKITSSDGVSFVASGDGSGTWPGFNGELGSVQIGPTSRRINGIDFGIASITTNASGEDTIAHDLGTASFILQVSNSQSNNNRVKVVAKTSTNFTVRMLNADGSVLGSGNTRTVDWVALAS